MLQFINRIVVLVIFTSQQLTSIAIKGNLPIKLTNARQAQYVSEMDEVEIIIPLKVANNRSFISYDLSNKHALGITKRRRRGVRRKEYVHYSLTIQRKEHLIVLQPNLNFISPQSVVETVFGNLSISTSDVRAIPEMYSCHFVGHIKNSSASKVAMSTCNGLTGFLHTSSGNYFIEPAKGQNRKSHEPHHHLIYKATYKTMSGREQNSCGSPGLHTNITEERQEWEKNRALEKLELNRIMYSNERTSGGKRTKRSVSLEMNVEVLVVADKEMVEYYKDEDINNYILTVMNMVSTIYHDASIGNAINIIVVKIILLESFQYEEELATNHDADKTLQSFCQWQKMINPSDDEHPHHHDVAVLLTRHNICSKVNNRCSTLGLAEIAGMCQPHRACSVNEDTGLQIAYTVAHELGHNFGMSHDSISNGCGSKEGFSQYVMSPHLATDSVSIKWSSCSRNQITHFLDHQWGYCLEDKPSDVEYSFPELPPGAMYDADHQCRLAFGPGTKRCNGIFSICEALWCQTNNRCITRLEPAVEGTKCGKHKWCFRGNCVTMGERPTTIHGDWGPWSEWSSCSRSCGAGVESAARFCDNPTPAFGGKYCMGDRQRYKICNTQPCEDNGISFRAQQCKTYDNILYRDRTYTWSPVILKDTPCQLHCKPDSEAYTVELSRVVIDGTPCKPGTRDMCIRGICKKVSCDWTIDGYAQEDRCGLCHGDGTQCVTTRGLYDVAVGNGYVSITTFPSATRNIRVKEIGNATNYLAIKDNSTDEYFLNGNWVIDWSGEYSVDGVMIYYRREYEKETLFLPGPLKKPLTLMLLFKVGNPGITWEYTLPHENASYNPIFNWKYSDWTICSQTCGSGNQISVPQCMEMEAGLVEIKYCSYAEPPEIRRNTCNTHHCPARWWSGPWQPCSVTCGGKGLSIRKRTVICVRSFGRSEQVALLDSECNIQERPFETESCPDLQPCPNTGWIVGSWTKACHGDPCEVDHRTVECGAASGECDPAFRPIHVRQCSNITCGYWQSNFWSECSTTCGDGIRIRNVTCIKGDACVNKDEPRSVAECYSECKLQKKNFINESSNDIKFEGGSSNPNDLKSLVDSENFSNIAKPIENQSVENILNKSRNHTSFPKLVNNSFVGNNKYLKQINTEKSMENLNSSKSNYLEKINDENNVSLVNIYSTTHKIGYEGLVSSNWVTTEIPQVTVNFNQETVNENEDLTGFEMNSSLDLDLEDNPLIKSVLKPNNEDTITNVSISNTTLAFRNQSTILDTDNTSAENIINSSDSEDIYEYNNDEYNYSDELFINISKDDIVTSENVSRPEGFYEDGIDTKRFPIIEFSEEKKKNRRNKIENLAIYSGEDAISIFNKFSEDSQKRNEDISTHNEKKEAIIYQWATGDWSECSKPCGIGKQNRPVKCNGNERQLDISNEFCKETLPFVIQNCNEFPCMEWQIGEWNNCSTKCGPGIRSRIVTCPEEGKCSPSDIPSLEEPCHLGDCLQWVEGPWSMCTQSCGGGYQLRFVQCIDTRSRTPSKNCLQDRPSHKKKCNEQKCLLNHGRRCKDRMNSRICKKLTHMCTTKFFKIKCCLTCHEIDNFNH